jgi:HSP20 family protein
MAQFPWNPWDKQKDRFPTKTTGFEDELRRLENEFAKALQEGKSFSYGFSIVSVNGQPIRQEIYAPNTASQPSITGQTVDEAEEREPLVDVIDEKDSTKVLFELPGIEKKDIKLTSDENTLEV